MNFTAVYLRKFIFSEGPTNFQLVVNQVKMVTKPSVSRHGIPNSSQILWYNEQSEEAQYHGGKHSFEAMKETGHPAIE